MILRIAWRNIWRNPVRSMIVIIALVAGMFSGVFATTFMHGWMMQRLRAGIETETSHIQMHRNDYLKLDKVSSYFNVDSNFVSKIRDVKGVKFFAQRTIVTGMASSAQKSQGVNILGVQEKEDSMVVNVTKFMQEGSWITPKFRNKVVVGQKLADELSLKLRSRIILRFQDVNDHLTGGAFRVVGIYKTMNSTFDQSNVFVSGNDIKRLTDLPTNACHEIFIRCDNPLSVNSVCNDLKADFPNLDIQAWNEISPELGYLQETMNVYMFVFVVIILIALGFGILNTMLMVVLERVHELGMLMAVGMQKQQIFRMILLETAMLSFIGGLIGVVLGVLVTDLTAKQGINLSLWSEGLSEMGFASVIYPEYSPIMISGVIILVLLTGILSALYPAYMAVKLPVSNALQAI